MGIFKSKEKKLDIADNDLKPIEAKDWRKLMEDEKAIYEQSIDKDKNKIEIKTIESEKEIICFEVENNLAQPTPIPLKKVNYYYGGKTNKNDHFHLLPESLKLRLLENLGVILDIYRMSMNENDEIISFGNKNFIRGYLRAYSNHCPIGFSPDIIWQIILVGFAKHINENSEKLRHLFVDFEGKKKLNVKSFTNSIEEVTVEEWQNIFSNLNVDIKNNVKGEIIELITPNFTTTTQTSLTAAQASIMASMKHYFDYSVGCAGCGIPKIYIEGTLEDWEKLLIKVKSLEKYNLKWWTDKLQEIILKFIETKKGNVDVIFWKYFIYTSIRQIVEYGNSGLERHLSNQSYIGGWILYLFPYNERGDQNCFYYFDNDKDFPEDITDCDIVVSEIINKKEIGLTLYSGFVGFKKDKNNDYYKPEIGWYLKK